MQSNDAKKYLAELIGTFVLVFIGCGSAVIAGGTTTLGTIAGIGLLGIAFAFGLAVVMMCYSIGHISGCHINPAITIAMLINKKINARNAAFYIVAQCVGAVIAAGVLFAIASGLPGYNIATNGLGQNGYGDHSPMKYSMIAGFAAEAVLTFIFLFTIFGATDKKAPEGFAGMEIGLSLVAIHLVGIPITGTSVNPARSIGPALFVGGDAITQLWLFIAAPIIGAVLAAVAWRFIFEKK